MGAGSVASYETLALAKAGVFDITVYDDDVIESHNVPMSLYRECDVGRRKVDALAERIHYETGITIKTHPEKYQDQPLGRTSLIVSIDIMDKAGCGRIPIWLKVKDSLPIDVMIDTRIDRWLGEIYTIVPTLSSDQTNYEQTLHPDAEMAQQVCGYHGIGSMAMAVAGNAVNSLFRYWNDGTHDWRRAHRYDTLAPA